MINKRSITKAVYFSLVSNIFLAIVKGIAGFFGNSYALIADSIESTSDIFTSFLVLFGLRYANKPADKNHPYGHGRAEPLITFIVVGFLIISATIIAYESIRNIFTPHELPKIWTLFILAPLIIWKEILFRFVLNKAKVANSSSLKAEAWHHRSDALTSVAAFIGISLALILGKGYEAADDWAALFASCFILFNSYLIFRPALSEIMDENTYDDLVNKIRKISLTVNGVLNTEKCLIRKTGLQYHIDLHATVDANISVQLGHDIAHKLEDSLKKEIPQIGQMLIHIEPSQY